MTLLRWFAPFLLFLALTGASQARDDLAVAYAGFLAGDGKRARLSIDFDRKIAARLRFSDEPQRVVIELSPSAFRIGKPLDAERSPLIGGVTFDQSDTALSRIILDLDAPVEVSYQTVTKIGSSERRRLIVDLARSSERAFARLVRLSPIAPRTAPAPAGAPTAERPLVVLDPGHGGLDGGAQGRGRTSEKAVTLAFARTLRAKLLATGRFRVEMTRESDRFVSLEQRVEAAREGRADLLISIHADSLRQRRIRGATVYTLSQTASDEVAAELATDQNRADLKAGLELPKLDTSAADILLDLMQRETDDASAHVAVRIIASLGQATRLIGNPNRSADFFVLRAPDVPSVLLELGYLSNRQDEKLLASSKWQAKVADALTAGLLAHFEARATAGR